MPRGNRGDAKCELLFEEEDYGSVVAFATAEERVASRIEHFLLHLEKPWPYKTLLEMLAADLVGQQAAVEEALVLLQCALLDSPGASPSELH